MQHVILGLLLTGPLSLYDVQKRFRAGISLFYSASAGSIQRALQRLVDEGSAVVDAVGDDRRGRKVHRITAAGRARWREWMLAPVPEGTESEKTILAKVFLLGRLENADDRRDVLSMLRARVDESAAGLVGLGVELDAQSHGPDAAERRIFATQRATLDYGVRAHRLLADWLGDLENTEREVAGSTAQDGGGGER